MPSDTVTLRNVTWDVVKVEPRKGNDSNIESNPSLGTRSLTRNSDWTINSNAESVYYGRDTDPDHPNGEWTRWTVGDECARLRMTSWKAVSVDLRLVASFHLLEHDGTRVSHTVLLQRNHALRVQIKVE
jgi:hypothetical protein